MSGSGNDEQAKPPVTPAADDPWAKWRQPEAADTGKSNKAPKSEKKADVVAKAEMPATTSAEVPAPAAPFNAEGTLGVRKTPGADTASRKRPVRGGALTRKPKAPAPAARMIAAEPSETTGKRPPRSNPSREAVKGDGRFVGKGAGKGFDKKSGGDGGRRPAGKAGFDAKPRGEDPWARSRTLRSANDDQGVPAPRQPAERVSADGPAPTGVRLSKVMSERGLCSRREADLWIERGWVFVNGEPVSELGSRIDPAAEITVSKEAVKDQAKAVTILLHKPVGYVSGQPEPDCVPAVTLITAENQLPNSGGPDFKPWMLRGLAPAGRLDIDSTGLLVLTSDGRVAKRPIGEDSDADKACRVRVSGQMIAGGLELLRHGLKLYGKALKPAWVKQLNEDQLHFILKEGKKRQIRRMCELVGLKVIGLKRVRIGRIRMGDLPMGQWRFLRADEAF